MDPALSADSLSLSTRQALAKSRCIPLTCPCRYGNQALRFVARFAYARGFDPVGPADLERTFILSFFLATDELLVYEPPVQNSGIVGGKFFERARAFKPGTRTYFGPSDFYVGARVPLVSRCAAAV